MSPDRLDLLCHAVKDAVVAHHGGTLPGRVYVGSGPPAYDCELVCVWAETTQGIGAGVDVPAFDAHPGSAGHLMRSAQLVVSVARCTPAVPDDHDLVPSVEEEESAATAVYGDAVRVLNALRQAEKDGDLPGCHGLVFDTWTNQGAEGGLTAAELRVHVSLSAGG